VLLLWAGHAYAQSATAEGLFDDGNKLMAAGKLAEACASFDASNRAEQRAGTLIRLGECREANHQIASAWVAYKDALTRVKDPRKRDIATERVAALEPHLSLLTITVAAGARVASLAITRDGKSIDLAQLGHALPSDGGDFAIVARAPGYEDWTGRVHVETEDGRAQIEIPALHEAPKPVAPAPLPVVVPPPPPPLLTPRRKIALGVGGLAVVSGVTAIALGVAANGKQTDAFAICDAAHPGCVDADRANALLATGRARAFDANVAYGVAGTLAVAAGVLWFTGGPSAERLAVVPVVAPGQASLAIAGGF
jgi:hypothetical protein